MFCYCLSTGENLVVFKNQGRKYLQLEDKNIKYGKRLIFIYLGGRESAKEIFNIFLYVKISQKIGFLKLYLYLNGESVMNLLHQ